ncbi:MAG: DDB1- and CUL4-associated factor 13 [Marteilia pararefringens]
MKIKLSERNHLLCRRETRNDHHPVHRNYDPTLHPFQQEREYQRALNSAKIQRMLSKPFEASFYGHPIQIKTVKKCISDPKLCTTLDHDGLGKIWDINLQRAIYEYSLKDTPNINEEDHLSCSTFALNNQKLITASKLGSIYFHDFSSSLLADEFNGNSSVKKSDIVDYFDTGSFIHGIDHQFNSPHYAVCGESVVLFDENRHDPIQQFKWGPYNIIDLKFNFVEQSLLACTTEDKGIVLYDTRTQSAIKKLVMHMEANCLSWNPMQPFIFTVGSQDYNLYTFDMRNLSKAYMVHMDHIAGVNDVDYCPSGTRFVSGSDDKTIRIFNIDEGRSNEIYHTKRMRNIDAIAWMSDNRYILSGSRDSNLRLWRPKASESTKILTPRERASRQYSETLVNNYIYHPGVRKIAKFRHLPKALYNERKHMEEMRKATKRKIFRSNPPSKLKKRNQDIKDLTDEKKSHIEDLLD